MITVNLFLLHLPVVTVGSCLNSSVTFYELEEYSKSERRNELVQRNNTLTSKSMKFRAG